MYVFFSFSIFIFFSIPCISSSIMSKSLTHNNTKISLSLSLKFFVSNSFLSVPLSTHTDFHIPFSFFIFFGILCSSSSIICQTQSLTHNTKISLSLSLSLQNLEFFSLRSARSRHNTDFLTHLSRLFSQIVSPDWR